MIMEFFQFYKVPILAGILVGILLGAIGIFVVLRRITLFGITLSQAAGVAVILSLIAGIHGEIFILFATVIVMLPFHFFSASSNKNSDAVLAGGFVFFTSLSHLLTAFGGGISNHLTRTFFGDILTVTEDEWLHLTIPILVIIPVFYFLLPYFKAVTFDRDETVILGRNSDLIELLFFLLLTFLLGMAIKLFGSLFSIAHLILPALAVLPFSKNVGRAVIFAMLFSAAATLLGFTLSFFPIHMGSEEIHLPTSTSIILFLSAGTFLMRNLHSFSSIIFPGFRNRIKN